VARFRYSTLAAVNSSQPTSCKFDNSPVCLQKEERLHPADVVLALHQRLLCLRLRGQGGQERSEAAIRGSGGGAGAQG
jgi:hypothetical protein